MKENECDYCEGLGTRTVSIENVDGNSEIEKEICKKCNGTGNTPTEPVIEDWAMRFDKQFGNQELIGSRTFKDFIPETYQEIKAFIRQTRLDLLNEIEYLKKIHEMELDAISLKSLEDFIIWSDNRKNKGLQVGVDIIRSKMK